MSQRSHLDLTRFYPFLVSASVHPRTLSETGFYILARHLSMLDSYRPNYQRGRYRSVSNIIDGIGHPLKRSDPKRWKVCREECTSPHSPHSRS